MARGAHSERSESPDCGVAGALRSVPRRTAMAGAIALLVSTGLATRVVPAGATFPGVNGRIAFGSDRSGGTHNIFTMLPDGSDVRQLTFLANAQGAALVESWSPDGTTLVFEQRNQTGSIRQIFVMNADGSNQHILFSDPSYIDRAASYSPDGSRVVFERCRTDVEACAIYTVKADGHGLTAVTHFDAAHNVLDASPEYSPDGRTIAFSSFNRGGVTAAVYLMGAHGTDVRMITPPSLEAYEPDWSPDGARIVFNTQCCTAAPQALDSARPDGTRLEQLTAPLDQHDFGPEYAPTGDRIVFERDAADFSTSSIQSMKPDGSGLTTIQADAFLPAWGPAR